MKKQCQHLDPKECRVIISLLRKVEDLFDGKLGTWNTKPVDLEIKDDVRPVCSCPYPLPLVNADMFRKEVSRLVSIGVVELANYSEWGALYLDQSKVK